jgi:hypothetical protein
MRKSLDGGGGGVENENREIRIGRLWMTVETEVNGDSKSTNERGPSLVGSLSLLSRYKSLFSA